MPSLPQLLHKKKKRFPRNEEARKRRTRRDQQHIESLGDVVDEKRLRVPNEHAVQQLVIDHCQLQDRRTRHYQHWSFCSLRHSVVSPVQRPRYLRKENGKDETHRNKTNGSAKPATGKFALQQCRLFAHAIWKKTSTLATTSMTSQKWQTDTNL